jgi:flagellar hook protein FlgE
MSIGSALSAGVSGLKNFSTKLATISDNIANSSTIGYKRSDTQFSTMVINSGSRSSYSAGGATTLNRMEIGRGGVITGSSVETDLAIAGGGFFTVSTDAAGTDFAFTRAGSFMPDETGALRNTAGYYLQGFALNPDGTTVVPAPNDTTFGDLVPINVNNINGQAVASTEVSFSGNIPRNVAVGATFQTGVQAFDAFGASRQLTFAWENTGANIWTLEIREGAAVLGTFAGIDFAAGTPGAPDYGASGIAADGTAVVNLPATGEPITINLGAANTLAGITQFDGDYLPETLADGAPLGELEALEVQEDGTMVALFNTGERRPVFRIPLADLANEDGLTAIDGNAFKLSADSGAFRLKVAGAAGMGQIEGGALEGSNVDMSTELTSLIETQRAYSSNATIIRTADEMLEEVTRLKR